MQKTLIGLVAMATGASLLMPAGAIAQDKLSIMSFGGAYQEAERKAVFEPYTAETGIRIIEQEYGGEIAKIKAMIEAGNTTLDVVDVDAPTLRQGCDEGIFEMIDWPKIGPESEWLDGTASECGVGNIVYSTILAYDTEKLTDGPKTIADLFDTQKFPGKRGLWKNPVTNLEFALLAEGVPPGEVYETLMTPEGLDRAFAKLDTIKGDILWWEAGAQAAQLLASNEVVMTTAWNGRIYDANREGRKFAIVWDNQILDSMFWTIPKGAKNIDASMAFIHYAVEPKVLAATTKYIPYGPVRSTAVAFVAPEDAANLPTSPENMKSALMLDNGFWGDHGEEIRRRFVNWLAQ
ncbi:ABC transporter substrate-binding protein [Paracoccus aminophilus]|uniref:ABC transporter, substrate-binding protein n=1 Tax=Paracoccus aminophilus JCM 7686 TaxID=1367847 RepID=S5Y4H2_PARAH|nr:ABC transporter substrate-binding protein [Paracoccus aminophilus]AGT10635.1 ABC transporter, substrate-binding protein [Paracoccus aminophilus JCM 7686]